MLHLSNNLLKSSQLEWETYRIEYKSILKETNKFHKQCLLSVEAIQQKTQIIHELAEDKKLQAFLKRLKNKKLLYVSRDRDDHKIWVDVQITLNELFWAMID